MSKNQLQKQCTNCYAWYTNLKGFKHHIRHCRRSNDGKTSDKVEHHIVHPMLSIHSTSSVFPFRSYFEKDNESAHNADMDYEVDYDFDENRDKNDLIFENDTDTAFHPLHRKTMSRGSWNLGSWRKLEFGIMDHPTTWCCVSWWTKYSLNF